MGAVFMQACRASTEPQAGSMRRFSSTAREREVLNGHFRVKVSDGVSNKTAAG
jgi:hypothetical protein